MGSPRKTEPFVVKEMLAAIEEYTNDKSVAKN